MGSTSGREVLSAAAMPREGSEPNRMLPDLHTVSATEAAFR